MEVLPHFYLHNYFESLSDTTKVIFQHNHYNTQKKIDLHEIRQVMFDQHVSDVIHPDWIEENDNEHYDIKLKYHVSDTQKSLIENCKTSVNRKILTYNNYIDEDLDSKNNVDYYLNKHGFRCKEFSDKESIAFIGCSHTFGTGVTQKEIWPELVSEHFNKQCVNLGITAVGIDYFNLYMNLFFKSEVKNCKAIVVMLPPSIRSSFFYKWKAPGDIIPSTGIGQIEWLDDTKSLSTADIDKSPVLDRSYRNSYLEVLQSMLINAENCFNRDVYAVNTIKNIADELNIPFLVYSSYDFINFRIEQDEVNILDFARDCVHAGKETHRFLSKKIIKDLEQNFDK
jgi:hypothetical protein